MTEATDLLTRQPMSQQELDALIVELSERLERSVPTLRDLLRARYAAERALLEARAKALLASKASSVTEKRAEADVASLSYRLEVDLCRERLHEAQELQKALTARLYALLNLNRRGG